MIQYKGQCLECGELNAEPGLYELRFDLKGESVNKFNAATLKEFSEVLTQLKNEKGLKGLLITSGKDGFIAGADVTEFLGYFKKSDAELHDWIRKSNALFNTLEDLPVPSVVAINGFALGGGFELCLAATYRVLAAKGQVGLPEVKLGIYPGWGGTVRLSRLCGPDTAVEWICAAEQKNSETALKAGAVDAVVLEDQLRSSALDLLGRAIKGEFAGTPLDWKKRVEDKRGPIKLNATERMMCFGMSKGFVGAQAGPNYPAPVAAIDAMERGATLSRDAAQLIETENFVKIAKTQAASSLVAVFLGDQYLKKVAKKVTKEARPVPMTAVLGAGIMGGGVAYQSASKGTPILMKDIAPHALELGMGEAIKLLEKQVTRGKLTTAKMAETLSRIHPTLSYGDFAGVSLVVEAVVENEGVKKKVLADLEGAVAPGTILTSNTSTISITRLAEALKHPENFCGMHFFNPVHRMPLVEVIRGKKSSDQAVATTVAYAVAMGKSPIIVNDCAGFLVNRVLFPYFAGFLGMVNEGVDFTKVDRVMEKFGWPMGPAYLLDVVGLDTAHHADQVMAREFPDRMSHTGKSAIELMFENKRFGQKNGKGFYAYVPDKKGAPKKELDPSVPAFLKPLVTNDRGSSITDEEIIERMMLPMIFECSRCLEEKIVAGPVEVDMGLVYGLGFPPFRGGAMRYVDSLGAASLVESAKRYQHLGKLFEPTAQIIEMAKNGSKFYGE